MTMLVDSHAHLTDSKLLQNLETILAGAKQEDVEKIITIGTTIKDSENALKLCESYENVFAGIGVYPDEMPQTDLTTIESKLEELLPHPKVVGIGETGIDILLPKEPNTSPETNTHPSNLNRQKDLFELHIKLALKYKLPIIIHNRNADEICYEILAKYKNAGLQGVFHCFTSSWVFAQKILDLGFYISFSGIITYPTGSSILQTVANIPLDRFLVETDAPYLAPVPHRGQTNEPKYVKMTLQKIAETKGLSFAETSIHAYDNTNRLFFSKKEHLLEQDLTPSL